MVCTTTVASQTINKETRVKDWTNKPASRLKLCVFWLIENEEYSIFCCKLKDFCSLLPVSDTHFLSSPIFSKQQQQKNNTCMYILTYEEIGRDRTDNKISDKLHRKKGILLACSLTSLAQLCILLVETSTSRSLAKSMSSREWCSRSSFTLTKMTI